MRMLAALLLILVAAPAFAHGGYLVAPDEVWTEWRFDPLLAALILFFVQLALNFAWSPIFFAAHAIQPALVVIVVMVVLAALAASQFRRIRPVAGYLMLPYLLWLCFAASLNSAIGRLNPGAGASLVG